MNNKIHNRVYLKDRRRNLRKNATSAESVLWKLLKNEQTGRKFRRQHRIENYIVDFYCPAESLIIELDGEIHNNLGQANADFDCDQRLKSLGFFVIRFENCLVIHQPERAVEIIKANFRS
ncbi:MAG: endonuclease domain-containing protein [Sphingobacteriaceae bacterium]